MTAQPAKKAAKKSAKKAAKKAAHHHPSHDLRRAYEHLGRIETLESALNPAAANSVSTLAALAQQELASGHGKSSADLLRAAEHLSFAALAPEGADTRVSPDLKAAIAAEYDHLLRRAADHWSEPAPRHPAVASLYPATLKQAQTAFKSAAYRQALELARAAEALAHITRQGPAKLPAPQRATQRLAS
jgi:hypothetical protein